jgi:ATP-binding cassette subfamily F protein 3
VLLLDEPTNHLDLDAIEWLEGYLKKQVGVVTDAWSNKCMCRI